MDKYKLQETVKELNELAGLPGYEERCKELAKALTAHYSGKDKKKEDNNQLQIPFK